MRFSQKKVAFRRGRLEQISRDSYENSFFIRFKVDGEFFFTNLLLFESADELLERVNGLAAGQEVFLGAHQLDDGSFWLHWLKIPGSIALVPLPSGEAARKAREKVRTWGLGAPLCFVLAFVVLFGGGISGGTALFSVLLLVGGAICAVNASDGAAVLVNSATSVDKLMRRGLESLNASLADGRAWEVPGLERGFASEPSLPENLPDELRLCQIGRVHVQSSKVSAAIIRPGGGRGRITVDFLVYTFLCGDESVSWAVRDETCSALRTPAFRRRHSPFLAEGDRVLVYCAEPPNGLAGFLNKRSLPDMGGKQALELFNCTDQTAYRSETDHGSSLPSLYAALGWAGAFSMLTLLIIALAGNSKPWFLPAFLSLLEFGAVAFCLLVVTMGVFLLSLELFVALSGKNPEVAAGRKHWRETIAPLRRAADVSCSRFRSPHLERLFAHRILIVPVCTAIAAGSLLLLFLS